MSSFKRTLFAFFLICVSLLQPSFAYDNCLEGAKRCTLAVFPHSNYKQLLITYKGLLEDLSLVLDTRVKLVSSRTMPEFAFKLDNKAYDIALIGPGQYVTHASSVGYKPMASRDNQLEIRLFVNADSDIKSYKDLKNRNIGTMTRDTTTWFATKILLKSNNIRFQDNNMISLGSQQACAHSLAIKKVDACFFAVSNLNVIRQQNVNIDVRPIGESISFHNPVYAVHPDMSNEVFEEIQSYLLSRENYIAVTDDDFDGFRSKIMFLK